MDVPPLSTAVYSTYVSPQLIRYTQRLLKLAPRRHDASKASSRGPNAFTLMQVLTL